MTLSANRQAGLPVVATSEGRLFLVGSQKEETHIENLRGGEMPMGYRAVFDRVTIVFDGEVSSVVLEALARDLLAEVDGIHTVSYDQERREMDITVNDGDPSFWQAALPRIEELVKKHLLE